MELRFIDPELDALDRVGAEVLVAALFRDERPARGVAGLFDWRSAGRLSRIMQEGFATGELGEVLMTPGKPCLPFEKVIFFGAGNGADFDDGVFGALVRRILTTMEGLRTRSVVAQLPGRHLDLIGAERAADILLDEGGDNPEHDVWTLVEDAAAQRAITEHVLKQRRRRA